MAFITVSNSKKLIKRLELSTFEKITESIYKKEIYFFSKKEKSILLGIRELLKDPDNFYIEYYNPVVMVDSLKYIYEEQQPAYHINSSCTRLNANFQNFGIPDEIKARGENEIRQFRQWFKENSYLLEKPDVFEMRLHARWGIISNPYSIEYSNSGIEDFSNLSLMELENKIDSILKDAAKYYKENPEKQILIKRFGKLTFLAYVSSDIYRNDTGLNDDELKDFLKFYDFTFKQPVRELLIQYYRVLYNPEMTFDGVLLDKLNFKPCGECHRIRLNDLDEPALTFTSFDWPLLVNNFNFFNQLFSAYLPFSENDLVAFHKSLSLGSPSSLRNYQYSSGYGFEPTVYGLIFNRNITWTKKLIAIYYQQSYLLYPGSAEDVYTIEINFEQLPLSFYNEIIDTKRQVINSLISSYGYSEEEAYYDGLSEGIDYYQQYYDNVLEKKTFTPIEVLDILRNKFTDFICNDAFANCVMNIINSEIKDFNYEKFIGLKEKD